MPRLERLLVGRQHHLPARDRHPLHADEDPHDRILSFSGSNGAREPILTLDGERIVDAKGRGSYVTSAGAAPSLGKHVLLAYLPPEHARVGEKLLVEYLNEPYPVTVDVAGSTPIFDPENTRVKS